MSGHAGPHLLITAALAAGLLAGCGGGPPESAPSAAQPAAPAAPAASAPAAGALELPALCDWLTMEEVSGLVGGDPAVTTAPAILGGCQWLSAAGMPVLQLTVVANSASSGDEYARRLAEEMGEAWRDEDLKPVAGLGDFAFYTADVGMLQVFRGQRTLQVIVGGEAGEAQATAVAGRLLTRDW